MPGGRGRGRGGYQKPSHPAPVAGPGALSARTDGGAAKPPLPTGQPYGARQDLAALQSVGPMTGPTPSLPPPAGGGTPPAAAPGQAPTPIDVFAPTARPGEPITAGIPLGPGPSGPTLPEDPSEYARWLYGVFPHPDIAELLEGFDA